MAVLLAGFARAGGADTSIRIDPSEPRAQIRQKLLAFTPLGESATQVSSHLEGRLLSSSGSPFPIRLETVTDPSGKPAERIQVVLGKYLTSPIPLTLSAPIPIVAQTSVTWIFDDRGRLVDIVVSKKLLSEK